MEHPSVRWAALVIGCFLAASAVLPQAAAARLDLLSHRHALRSHESSQLSGHKRLRRLQQARRPTVPVPHSQPDGMDAHTSIAVHGPRQLG
jgi:hypothetical protein